MAVRFPAEMVVAIDVARSAGEKTSREAWIREACEMRLASGGEGSLPARASSASGGDAVGVAPRPAPAAPADLMAGLEASLGPARTIVAGADVRRVRLEVVVARMGVARSLGAAGVAELDARGPAPVDLARARAKVKRGEVLVNEVVEKDPGRLIGEEMVALR